MRAAAWLSQSTGLLCVRPEQSSHSREYPRLRDADKRGKWPSVPISTPTHRNEGTPGIFAATLSSRHTLVLIEDKAMVAETALLAVGGSFGAGDLTVVGARR